ncbi:DUF559 domain-containing protein [Aestuariimicrobium soli]|uniref:DUF559 domain-containing protein n=1 Tax=Aestuariimicrobium soli TaxID=2035834 RepID=UPI003EB73E63
MGDTELQRELERAGGCLRLARVPHLAHQARRAVAKGACVRPFPGILMDAGLADDPLALTRALLLWRPDAVLLVRSAARLTHWPAVPLVGVDASVLRLTLTPPSHVSLTREVWNDAAVQFDTVARTLRLAAGALWAAEHGDLDLAFHGLREGIFTPEDLRAAAEDASHGHRKSWVALARQLRSNPWSHPELETHQLLRGHGIRGWTGNHRIRLEGSSYIGDVVFVQARRILEVASTLHHSSERAVEMDYRRHLRLEGAGWRVAYVTPRRLRNEPEAVVREVRAFLRRTECGLWII